MTIAAAIESRTAETSAWSKTSRLCRADFFAELDQAEPIWRALEDRQHFSTPYQRFDFLGAWQRHVGRKTGRQPFIVVATDAERRPLLLLPLVLSKSSGIRVAQFMGGKHATFNMGLWDGDFARDATRADLEALLSAIRERFAADVLALSQQPLRWRGQLNPMALLPHQPSVNDCPLMTMAPDSAPAARVSNSLRRRLNGKERKLKSLPGYRYHIATSDAEIARLLDAFFRIKPQRMAEQKLPNVFAEPGVEDFVRDACAARLANDGRVTEIHCLECDDEVIAISAGVGDGDRFSMMFNTYTISENSRYSPGLILIRNVVDHYAESGYRSFDLGVGTDGYKSFFCKGDEPLFDSFIPLGFRGKIAAAAMSGMTRAKHLVKHTPVLLSASNTLRGMLRQPV